MIVVENQLDYVSRRYAPAMTTQVTTSEWTPLPNSLPEGAEPGKVYVLPTRLPPEGSEPQDPIYLESMRYVPKEARLAGVPVEFSVPSGSRHFLSEYSSDPGQWSIALSIIGMVNEWIIAAVVVFVQTRIDAHGVPKEEAAKHPLKVSIAELYMDARLTKGITLEGESDAVIEALKELVEKPKADAE